MSSSTIEYQPLRVTLTPRLWSSLSHRRKQEVKKLFLSGKIYERLFTDVFGRRELS